MTTTTRLSELSGDYVLDAGRTRIGFVARHRFGTRVRGRFAVFEGGAHLDGDDPARSSARITIRADSIETGDKRRDAQLTKDFLGAATYPVLSFVSTRVEQVDATTFDVTGDLTIRGVKRSITIPFTLTGDGTFHATQTINRMDWRANWNVVTTILVSPDAILDLQLTAIRG
jgi:polyisoprenoid-binding protein YceI